MNNNEQWAARDEESSDETDKDRKKKEKLEYEIKAKAATERLAKSFARSEGGLLGVLNERKDFSKIPVRPPLPLEKIIISSSEKDDEDDEDEEAEKDESKSEISTEAVSKAGEPGSEAVGNPSEEVFETMASAKHSEFVDIPHVDYDKPSIPLTSAENNAFAEMVSGVETPDDTERKDIPPIPSWEMPTVSHPLGSSESAPPEPAKTASSTVPFWRSSPIEASAPSASVSSSESATSGSYSPGEVSSGVTAVVETLKAATSLVEMINNPNRLITRALTEAVTRVALDGYLKQRRQGQGNAEAIVRQQKGEIAELQDRQRQANERLTALFQEQAKQGDQEGQEFVDQNGNRIQLQPGQHIERSAGGYSVVVDAHGRPVSEAITYGEAYQHEQQREQLSDDAFAAPGGGSAGSTQDNSVMSGLGSPFPPMPSQPQSGQYPYLGPPSNVDLNHRLPESQNDSKKSVVSPWLWTAVAIIIIIYFIAQMA